MRRDINFFSVYRTTADTLDDKFKIISLSLLVGSLVIVLATFASLKLSDISVRRSIDEANAYLQTPEVVEAKKAVEEDMAKIASLNKYKQAALRVSSGCAEFPKIDSELFRAIAGMMPSDVEAESITYDGKTIALTCTCKDSASPAVFVHALDSSGRFKSVNYSALEAAAGSNGGSYSFSVAISLKGGNKE